MSETQQDELNGLVDDLTRLLNSSASPVRKRASWLRVRRALRNVDDLLLPESAAYYDRQADAIMASLEGVEIETSPHAREPGKKATLANAAGHGKNSPP